MEFHAFAEFAGFQANGADNQVQPFISAELAASFAVEGEVESAQLDWSQFLYVKRVIVVLNAIMCYYDFSPDAAFQEPVIVLVILLANGNTL